MQFAELASFIGSQLFLGWHKVTAIAALAQKADYVAVCKASLDALLDIIKWDKDAASLTQMVQGVVYQLSTAMQCRQLIFNLFVVVVNNPHIVWCPIKGAASLTTTDDEGNQVVLLNLDDIQL